jgi:tRNA(Leu) C34 or U34 (ribose-2'-O)-methylase TrmL
MRGFAAIGLDRCKDKANLGGVLRAAGCYGASMVALGGGRLGKYATDTMKTYKHIPCIETADLFEVKPFGAKIVVVELCESARSIKNFVHPGSAFYVFGPEDGNVSKRIVDAAYEVIYIPTHACMNLAATVNVVLFDRMNKMEAT